MFLKRKKITLLALLAMSKPSLKYQQFENRDWYSLRSILGNDWAMFYILLGGREAGKSWATSKFFCNQFKKYGRPFFWLRLTEASKNKLLQNNAESLVPSAIRRDLHLDLETSGDNVYNVERNKEGKVIKKTLMCRVKALSTFYNDKGSDLFDKDFLSDPNMYYNICLDEMNREKNERKTFDILYAFVNQLENLVRSTKLRMRIIMIGNTLEEASDLMVGFNFIPEEFGRYYLVKNKKKLEQFKRELEEATIHGGDKEKSEVYKKYKDVDFGHRCVIDYIPLNDAYKIRRTGTVADILTPNDSTFTNEIKIDISLVTKEKLMKPTQIIKFTKDKSTWFTVWDGYKIAPFNGEKISDIVHMIPYENTGLFDKKLVDNVYVRYMTNNYRFKNLLTQKKFKKQLELLKPRG